MASRKLDATDILEMLEDADSCDEEEVDFFQEPVCLGSDDEFQYPDFNDSR